MIYGLLSSLWSMLGITPIRDVRVIIMCIVVWSVLAFVDGYMESWVLLLQSAAMGYWIFQNREILQNGVLGLVNRGLMLVENYYGISLEHFSVAMDLQSLLKGFEVLMVLLCLLLSLRVFWYRKMGLFYLVLAAVFGFGLFTNTFPEPLPFFLLLFGILGFRAANQFSVADGKLKISIQFVGVLVLLLGGAALSGHIATRLGGGQRLMQKYEEAQKFQNQLEAGIVDVADRVRESDWNPFGWFADKNEDDGALSNRLAKKRGKTELVVTLEEKPKQSIYLKGFVGADYQGSRWKILSEQEFQQKNAGLASVPGAKQQIQQLPFEYLKMYEALQNSSVGEDRSIGCEVELVGEEGAYAFAPYFSQSTVPLTYEADGLLLRNGQKKLSYRLYQNVGYVPELNVSPNSDYTQFEEDYWDYVKERYLRLPEGLSLLKAYAEQLKYYCISVQAEPMEVVKIVREQLGKQCSYNLDIKSLPKGEDFAEYFFFEQKQGFCVHFATTGVLLLRMIGIPSRYATGYIAQTSDFKKTEAGWRAEVKDESAHAWVEVYFPQMGWIPVEMTPAYPQLALENVENRPNLDPEVGKDVKVPTPETPKPTKTPQVSQAPSVTPKPEKPVVERNSSQKAYVLLGFLALAALGVLGAFLGMAAVRAKREYLFSVKRGNRAVCEMAADCCRKLEKAGYAKEEALTDSQYAQKIQSELQGLKPGEFVSFFDEAQRARFGNQKFSPAQIREYRRRYEKICGLIYLR